MCWIDSPCGLVPRCGSASVFEYRYGYVEGCRQRIPLSLPSDLSIPSAGARLPSILAG